MNRLLALCFLAACARVQSEPLDAARRTYDRAAHGPAKHDAPKELREAEQALKRAELFLVKDGEPGRTTDLAYVAQRRAQVAEARAGLYAAEQRLRRARLAHASATPECPAPP